MKKKIISIIATSTILINSSMFSTNILAYENNDIKIDMYNEEEIVVNKIRNLSIYGQTSSTVTLKWDAPETVNGLVEYIIYKDGKELDRVPRSKNGYTARELGVNRSYGFKVFAKYSNDKESKPVSINVRTSKEEQEIVINKAQNIINNGATQNSFEIGWEDPENTYGLVEHVIYKDGNTLESIPAGTNKYTLDGLRTNTVYGAKVTAKYLNGKESKPISINIRTSK